MVCVVVLLKKISVKHINMANKHTMVEACYWVPNVRLEFDSRSLRGSRSTIRASSRANNPANNPPLLYFFSSSFSILSVSQLMCNDAEMNIRSFIPPPHIYIYLHLCIWIGKWSKRRNQSSIYMVKEIGSFIHISSQHSII